VSGLRDIAVKPVDTGATVGLPGKLARCHGDFRRDLAQAKTGGRRETSCGSPCDAFYPTGLNFAEGWFPSVSGVSSETDNGVSDACSLQMNTNTFDTATCSRANPPPNTVCKGWEQAIYASEGAQNGCYIQYSLLNYGTSCPDSTWTQSMGSCFKNSWQLTVPVQPITELASLNFPSLRQIRRG
jgi:hypothetical protein